MKRIWYLIITLWWEQCDFYASTKLSIYFSTLLCHPIRSCGRTPRAIGGKPLCTSSNWWDAYSVMMSWTTHLPFWCSAVVKHINLKGKEERRLVFHGTGLLAAAPGAVGGRNRLPARRCQGEQLPSPAWPPNRLHVLASTYHFWAGWAKTSFCNLVPSVADFYLIWRPSASVTEEPWGEMARTDPVQWASFM